MHTSPIILAVALNLGLTSAVTYKSSFTHYGAGDTFGSPNCNTKTAACGFFTQPGFSAAVVSIIPSPYLP